MKNKFCNRLCLAYSLSWCTIIGYDVIKEKWNLPGVIQGKKNRNGNKLKKMHRAFEGYFGVIYDGEVGFPIGTWLPLPWCITS